MVDSGKPFIKEEGEAAEKAKMEKLSALLGEWQRQRAGQADEDYRVGVDDVLDIEILSLESPGTISKLTRTIDKDGMIFLPLVDRVNVSGQSEMGVRNTIKAVYDGKYLKDPQVTVKVKEYRSAGVIITGSIQKPGICYLQKNGSTVLDILAMAGGLSATAGEKLYISRSLPPPGNGVPVNPSPPDNAVPSTVTGNPEGTTEPLTLPAATNMPPTINVPESRRLVVDLRRLIEEGDVKLNIPVMSGDIVTVPPRIEKYIYVLGYVQRPGPITLRSDQPLRALNVLAMAGGVSFQGRAEKTYLIRDTEKGEKKIINVDLSKVARGVRPDVEMKAGDTLVVGSDFLMKLTEIIRPSFSAGASATTAVNPLP